MKYAFLFILLAIFGCKHDSEELKPVVKTQTCTAVIGKNNCITIANVLSNRVGLASLYTETDTGYFSSIKSCYNDSLFQELISKTNSEFKVGDTVLLECRLPVGNEWDYTCSANWVGKTFYIVRVRQF